MIRYSFTQCPNGEFAKRHHMEDVLPVMCNCDHPAMQKLHACLIREGTCDPLKKYGYNIKSQLFKLLVIFPAASAIAAWICSLLG